MNQQDLFEQFLEQLERERMKLQELKKNDLLELVPEQRAKVERLEKACREIAK